jgi:serine/threonine-protein kinase
MAEVHVGRDTRLGRTVAIKVLRSDLARDPAFQTRFRREAQAAASLNHPAIVAVYDTGEDVSTDAAGQPARVPFIIMEYVEGHTLRELMRDGAALPIDEAIDITIGVLSALQYAHHAGIVHRDIKPANIMLTAAGQVKVMDFGIARALADTAATMTQTQAVIGTAQYLSPEQARGETVDARSDLYSTGCVLYELLTGRPPFVGDSAVAVAYQHVREQPVAPSTLAPDVPEVLDRIVLKGLSKDRDLRYTTASEFRGDLEIAKRGGMVTAPPINPVIVPPTAGFGADPTQVISGTGLVPPPSYPTAPTQVRPATPIGPPSAQTLFGQGGRIPEPDEEDEDAADAETRRKRRLIIGAIVAAVVLILALIVFAMTQGGTPAPTDSPTGSASPSITEVPPVQVPEVGKSIDFEQAEAELATLHLVAVEEAEASEDVEEGKVLRYEPASGQSVQPGSEVKVFVSTGPDIIVVPDVKGMTQSEARDALDKAHLVGGNAEPTTSPDIPTGGVVRTDPEIGQPAERGATVEIWTSNGNTVVPDVKDRDEEDAKLVLTQNGLKAGESKTKLSDKDPGTVLSQTPKSGATVAQGEQVTLTIARAAEDVKVPAIANLSKTEAEAALVKVGLKVSWSYEYSSSVSADFVVRADPAVAKTVKEGQTITVYLSSGPEPAPPPVDETVPVETPVIPPESQPAEF